MCRVDRPRQCISATTRRRFLATAIASGAPMLARSSQVTHRSASHPLLAYVGTYSSPQGPEGAQGRGQGIYLFEMNPLTGALQQRAVFPNDSNPAWLSLDPTRTHLYSANEVGGFQGAAAGSVSAYAIDRSNGHLTLLNAVSSQGAGGPAHMSIHPSGKYAFAANYAAGTFAVLPIAANGELGPATDVIHDQGRLGSEHATSAPIGSFAISGHDKPHAHMIQSDPAGRFVLGSDWRWTAFSFGNSTWTRGRWFLMILPLPRCLRVTGRAILLSTPTDAGSIRFRRRLRRSSPTTTTRPAEALPGSRRYRRCRGVL